MSDMWNQSTLMDIYKCWGQSTTHHSNSPNDSQLKKVVYSKPMQQNQR